MSESEQKQEITTNETLMRDELNPPNLITLSRLFLAGILFLLIYINGLWITAAIIFVVAAATDECSERSRF